MTTILVKRWGGGGRDPTESDMQAALAELSTHDPEHPDCWLSDENGWAVAAHESGTVVLENVENEGGPWHIPNTNVDMVMKLWRHLQAGEIEILKSYPWKDGYQ